MGLIPTTCKIQMLVRTIAKMHRSSFTVVTITMGAEQFQLSMVYSQPHPPWAGQGQIHIQLNSLSAQVVMQAALEKEKPLWDQS